MFLSDKAPFYFPGFSIMCVGFASVRALLHDDEYCLYFPMSVRLCSLTKQRQQNCALNLQIFMQMIAFVQSLMIRAAPPISPISSQRAGNCNLHWSLYIALEKRKVEAELLKLKLSKFYLQAVACSIRAAERCLTSVCICKRLNEAHSFIRICISISIIYNQF